MTINRLSICVLITLSAFVIITHAQGRGRGRIDSFRNRFGLQGDETTRNNARNNTDKKDKDRKCDGLTGEALSKCKVETKCKGLSDKKERKECKKELRCLKEQDENKRKRCETKELCSDLEDEDEQRECRVKQRCEHLKGSRKNKCAKAQANSCNQQSNKAARQQCKAEQLCAYLDDAKEKQDCVRSSIKRCSSLSDEEAQEICLEERKANKADRSNMLRLTNRLNRRAARYKLVADQRRGYTPAPRPAIARKQPGQKPQVSEMSINEDNKEVYFGGDMELTVEQLQDYETQLDAVGDKKRKKRKVTSDTNMLWDTFPIPYQFDSGLPPQTRQVIRDAIRLWEANTCVRWQEDGPGPDRIEFYNGGGCASYVGRVGGLQEISIATPGCDIVGIASHEIGHSLGFMHEQARADQDKYINVLYGNINPFRWNNFLPADPSEMNDYSYSYDFGSVMHYDGSAFSLNPSQFTLETIDPLYQQTIGQRQGPSFIDFAQVNGAYCANKCPVKLPCQHGGYTDPNNCGQCKCPSGFGGNLCDVREAQSCGGALFATPISLEIETPGYPGLHPLTAECTWHIKAATGSKIFIEFVDAFEFSCKDSCDEAHVEVKLGGNWQTTGYRFCCDQRPPQMKTESNELVVIFRSTGVTQKRGFKARYWSDGTTPPPTTTTTTTQSTTTTSTTTTTTMIFTTPSTTLSTTTPTTTTTSTTPSTTPSTTTPSGPQTTTTDNKPGCQCSEWGSWQGACTQDCGGCGQQTRKRSCNQRQCYDTERRKCNFTPCGNRAWLWNNGEFHLLFDGCCIGQFKTNNQCTGSLRELFGTWLPAFDTIKLPIRDNPLG